MTYKIVTCLTQDGSSPAFDGVPYPTGVEFEVAANEDRIASRLLNFIDGAKTIGMISEDLPLTAAQLAGALVRLYEQGSIAFDPAFGDQYMVQERFSTGASVPPSPSTPPPIAPPVSVPPGRLSGVRDAPPSTAPPPPLSPRISGAPPAGTAAAPGGYSTYAPPATAWDAGAGRPAAPRRPEKEEIAVQVIEESNLEEVPLWQRITQLERRLFNGKVQLNTKSARREFFFLNGTLAYATSDNPEEDTGELLFRKKKMTQKAYDAYREELAKGGRDPFYLLIELGVIPDHQKIMAQRWTSQVIAFGALKEKEGAFIVEKWERLPREIPRLDLNFRGIMARFMTEVLDVQAEAEKLQDKMDYWVIPLSDRMDLHLNEKELRLWDVVCEQPRRLRDIMVLTTMYRKDTYRFILTLLTSGFVEVSRHPPVEEGPLDLRKLNDIVDLLAESNCFDVLTAHPVSSAEDIKKAYDAMARKFDPASYKSLTEAQKAKIIEGRRRVDEAWEALREESGRRDYRNRTYTAYQLRQYAQLQYQKGEIYLWWREDFAKAYEYFSSSRDLDPQNQLYVAASAYSVVMMQAPEPALMKEAVERIERLAALGMADPNVFVLAGGACLRIGRRKAADALFEKALKVGAQDEANIQTLIRLVRDRNVGPGRGG